MHTDTREKKRLRTALAYLRLVFLCLSICVLIAPVQIASAAINPKEKLDMWLYAQANAPFYDPRGENCDTEPVDNGKYKGAQYSFNEDQLKRLIRAAFAEQGPSGEAYKTELAVFANVYESGGGEPGNNDGLINYLLNRLVCFFYWTGLSFQLFSLGMLRRAVC